MKKKESLLLILIIALGALIAVNYNLNKEQKNAENNTVSNDIIIENNINTVTNMNITDNNLNANIIESNVIEAQEENNTTNNSISEGNISYNNKANENSKPTNATVKITLSPSGFMGSSLKKVALYSNGEVYMINYNGEGYEEKNIVSRELLAKNVDNIIYKGQEEFEAIIIKGKKVQKINTNYSWIEFEE